MLRLVVGVLGLACFIAPAAVAQQQPDTVLLERGQRLYQENCALCHRDLGAGDPPTFPALRGSDQLRDPMGVVRTIRQGRDRMPPFPGLTAEELSALVNYVRNVWADGSSNVTTEEVAAVLGGLEETPPMGSVWDGVFTEAQANRGQAAYEGACGNVSWPQIEWRSRRSGYAPRRHLWRVRGFSASGREGRSRPYSNSRGRRCRKTTRTR